MIKIYSFVYSRPEFIDLQLASFRKYLQDDFELIAVYTGQPPLPVDYTHHASVPEGKSPYDADHRAAWGRDDDSWARMSEQCQRSGVKLIAADYDAEVEEHCRKIQLKNVNAPHLARFDANHRFLGNYGFIPAVCSYTTEWTWRKLICGKETGPVWLTHGDGFLQQPIKFTDYLQRYPICSVVFPVEQNGKRVEPFFNTCFLADMAQLPDPFSLHWWGFYPDEVNTGDYGETWLYRKAHPEVKTLALGWGGVEEDGTDGFRTVAGAPPLAELASFEDNVAFLHYRGACNWYHESEEYHAKKTAWLRNRIGI